MKKFYICPNGIQSREAPWWTNFRLGIGKSDWPGDVLEEKYNAVLINITDDQMPYVLFDTEEDAVAFFLRWLR